MTRSSRTSHLKSIFSNPMLSDILVSIPSTNNRYISSLVRYCCPDSTAPATIHPLSMAWVRNSPGLILPPFFHSLQTSSLLMASPSPADISFKIPLSLTIYRMYSCISALRDPYAVFPSSNSLFSESHTSSRFSSSLSPSSRSRAVASGCRNASRLMTELSIRAM